MIQAAAAVATFNLICTGTMSSEDITGSRSDPYRYEYRVDLDRGKWCEGDCRALHDFANVGPTQLTLQQRERDTPSERSMTHNFINRETGEHRIVATSSSRLTGIIVMEWRGTCERAQFTGFPTFNTRF